MGTRTRLGGGGGGGRQLGWGEMAQIVSGARHFVQYVTCLAVSRETSVLEGTAVTTHNSI